jgi:hypothetical protein
MLLSQRRNMNLYYEVMHKIEFKHFNHCNIKAQTKSHKKDLMKELRDFLAKETDQEWHIELTIHSHIESVYDKLVKKLKESRDWQMITKYFPDAHVKDITNTSIIN